MKTIMLLFLALFAANVAWGQSPDIILKAEQLGNGIILRKTAGPRVSIFPKVFVEVEQRFVLTSITGREKIALKEDKDSYPLPLKMAPGKRYKVQVFGKPAWETGTGQLLLEIILVFPAATPTPAPTAPPSGSGLQSESQPIHPSEPLDILDLDDDTDSDTVPPPSSPYFYELGYRELATIDENEYYIDSSEEVLVLREIGDSCDYRITLAYVNTFDNGNQTLWFTVAGEQKGKFIFSVDEVRGEKYIVTLCGPVERFLEGGERSYSSDTLKLPVGRHKLRVSMLQKGCKIPQKKILIVTVP